jgi:hypothetical protein
MEEGAEEGAEVEQWPPWDYTGASQSAERPKKAWIFHTKAEAVEAEGELLCERPELRAVVTSTTAVRNWAGAEMEHTADNSQIDADNYDDDTKQKEEEER